MCGVMGAVVNRFAAVAVVSALAVFVTAASAGAAGPFTDYRQASQAQYGGNPPGPPPDKPPGRPPSSGSGTAPGDETGGPGQGQGQGGQGQGTGQGGASSLLTTTTSLFFLSPVDPVIVASVNAVFARIGEPPVQAVSLTEPLNVADIAAAAGDTRYGKITAKRLGLIRALGARIGRELVTPSPFLTRLGTVLFTGLTSDEPQKYVVFARIGGKLDDPQATKVRNAFEKGLVRGVRSTRIPTAGVETTRAEPSQIKWYKARKLSSVDNVDTLNGQRALLAILRDGAKGHFGVKDTAQRLLPTSVKVDPAAATIGEAKGESDTGFGTGLAITLLALMSAWTTLAVVSRVRRSR